MQRPIGSREAALVRRVTIRISAMPGYHVHGAWAPCTYDDRGRLHVGSGLHGGCCCQGTILVVSTASHDLRDYWVYTTDGVSTMPPQFHDWHYEGTVAELLRDAPKKPSKRNIERI